MSRNQSIAHITLATIAAFANASASTRPVTGGTLRVQISERVDSIDPRQWPSTSAQIALAERVDALVYDRLIQLDEHASLQPALAISWQHDAQAKHWEFRLRDGVKFSDGAPLTPPVAAMALQQLLGASFDVNANSDSVVIQTEQSSPDLALQLATGRYFIFRVGENDSLSGTGPFRVANWPANPSVAKITFYENELCWAGRPFVGKIELAMNVSMEQQANAIAFGQADVVELSASEVRRASQRGVRTASSEPVNFFALVFDASRPSVRDARLRQAISLSIDRSSIADVILQKHGIPAGGLLPNWISGYAHLFPPAFDLPKSRNLLAASPHEHLRSSPLVLTFDSGDAEAHAVADRVAVNLREAGITVQVLGQNADGKLKAAVADMRLIKHRFTVPDASASLAQLLKAIDEPALEAETIEQVYASERATIDSFRVIPLVHASESYGLSPQVRDWMAPRWGGWDFADVWLAPSALQGGNSK